MVICCDNIRWHLSRRSRKLLPCPVKRYWTYSRTGSPAQGSTLLAREILCDFLGKKVVKGLRFPSLLHFYEPKHGNFFLKEELNNVVVFT